MSNKNDHAKQRLTNIVVREVSLVDRPANQQPFLIVKRHEGDDSMSSPLNPSIPEQGVDVGVKKATAPTMKDMKIFENLAQAISAMMATLPEDKVNSKEAKAVAEQLSRLEDYMAQLIEQMGGKPPQTASEAQADGEMQSEADAMGDEAKGGHSDWEKKSDPSKKKAKEDDEEEGETQPPADESPKAEKSDEAPSVDLSELRDLLASLHGELGKQTQKSEEIAKRLDVLESARMPSRSTGEVVNKSTQTADVFSGLIFSK